MRLLPLILVLILGSVEGHAGSDRVIIDRSGGWDVNGPLGPSSELSFTASEGTWMNLDIHPQGKLMVFDLLGDLYLMPVSGGKASRLTEGAGYDFQARFSPGGKSILFTSDRGGLKTIWLADFDGTSLNNLRELNDKAENVFSGANWSEDGNWILARRRVTDTSGIGIAELWMFHRKGGRGLQLVADQGELDSFSASPDGRFIYFGQAPRFQYGRNPHGVVWSVNRLDRETGERRLISAGNGSSASHQLSPDGQTIAFVRRVGTRSTLWLHDLASGAERQLWDGLDRDQIEAFGLNFVYPLYDWMPDSESLVVWAQGGFYKVSAGDGGVEKIPFTADVEQRYHLPLRFGRDPVAGDVRARLIRWPVFSADGKTLVFVALGHLYQMEVPGGTPRRITAQDSFEFAPVFSADGSKLAFTTWDDVQGAAVQVMSHRRGRFGSPRTVYQSRSQLVNPAFSPDGKQLLVVQGSGANLRGEEFLAEARQDILVLNASGRGQARFVTSTASRGTTRRMTRPSFSAGGERIWFFEDLDVEAEPGERVPPGTVLLSIKLDGSDRRSHLQLRYAQEAMVSPDGTRVAFTEQHNTYVTVLPKTGDVVEFDPSGASTPYQQLSRDGGSWVQWSGDSQFLSWGFADRVKRLAVGDLELSPEPAIDDREDEGVLVQGVLVMVGGDYRFNNDSYDLDSLKSVLGKNWPAAAQVRVDVSLEDDASWGDWQALDRWLGEEKIGVALIDSPAEEPAGTDQAQLQEVQISLQAPRSAPRGLSAITHARIITMNGDEVIENGTVVLAGNRIAAVGASADVDVPAEARVFDASGKTVMPGIIDVHAHMGYSTLDINPRREWRYYANLAYGVTTTHDPAASTETVFAHSEMVEAGLMVGPRIFSTGYVLYGAHSAEMAVINSYSDALSHVRRLKSLGAFSVKSYLQPRRSQRQWLVRAAAAESMLVMPEGSGDFPDNMGMLLDGHSGIEHALSVGDIYQDVVQLFATSRAAYTATLLVAYGGQRGENWFYQHHDVWKNQKLQSFFPPRRLDSRSRRRIMSAEDDFNHKAVARGLKQVVEAGGLVTLGAHGQVQGLGAHWELWALTQGGMKPHDALRAATLNGAEYLGMDAHLGSIEEGKLADLVVLGQNPLERIENTESIEMTISNGVVYDAETMDQVWPEPVPRGRFMFQRQDGE